VLIVEVSASGAKIVHDEDIPRGSRGLLRFSWRGREVEIIAQITRTEGAHSGLHFLQHDPALDEMISSSATELLSAQQANADGDRARNVIGDETLTAASARSAGSQRLSAVPPHA
jgi:hypothetical protein